jgi:hypothetical protein
VDAEEQCSNIHNAAWNYWPRGCEYGEREVGCSGSVAETEGGGDEAGAEPAKMMRRPAILGRISRQIQRHRQLVPSATKRLNLSSPPQLITSHYLIPLSLSLFVSSPALPTQRFLSCQNIYLGSIFGRYGPDG